MPRFDGVLKIRWQGFEIAFEDLEAIAVEGRRKLEKARPESLSMIENFEHFEKRRCFLLCVHKSTFMRNGLRKFRAELKPGPGFGHPSLKIA
jgi:hypothetical protein